MGNGFSYTTRFSFIFWLLYLITLKTSAQQEAPGSSDTSSTVSVVPVETTIRFDRMHDSGRIATRSVPDSLTNQLRQDADYWYVNKAPERPKQKEIKSENKDWYDKDWVSKLLWFLVIAAFVAVLIWFLASSNIQLFRRRPMTLMDKNEALTEENIFNLDYEKEIRKAVAQQDYRLAVRLWYVYLLTEMAQKNLIEFKHERTNREYLRQLSDTPYHKEFFRLTWNFEYTWYGHFDLSAATYALLEKDFLTFKQQLP